MEKESTTMTPETLVAQLNAAKQYFDKSTACLDENDSGFAPSEEMFTVAQQVAHTAQTVDWFIEGAFGTGFNMDFEGLDAKARKTTSLQAARDWLEKSFKTLTDLIASKTMEELTEPIPDGPIMAGLPRMTIVSGLVEHTSHHRGALSVYARLLGKVPAMPYM
jgi:uncharacterized damage-inducible protein DinB